MGYDDDWATRSGAPSPCPLCTGEWDWPPCSEECRTALKRAGVAFIDAHYGSTSERSAATTLPYNREK